MLLEPEVAPHRGLPRVLRLEVLNLDDKSFAFLFVLVLQSDHLAIIPVPMGQHNCNLPPHGERTQQHTHATSIPPRLSCSSPFRLPALP